MESAQIKLLRLSGINWIAIALATRELMSIISTQTTDTLHPSELQGQNSTHYYQKLTLVLILFILVVGLNAWFTTLDL